LFRITEGRWRCRSTGFYGNKKEFYKLSQLDFEIPIVDLGDLVSGKSVQDTHYILQEVLSAVIIKEHSGDYWWFQ
jgi:hypothetical protein